MSITKNITLAILAAVVSFSALADSEHPDDGKAVKTSTEKPMAGGQMPMMAGQKGGMPMMQGQGNMPMMKMMQERHTMMQAHMRKMETHMANIEDLLKQLVELQKQ